VGKNADAVRKGIELFNQGKIREGLSLYDDRATVEIPGSILGGAYKGKQALTKYFQQLGATFPKGIQRSLENVYEAGDTVIAEWIAKATLANGKALEWRAASVFQLKNGKIVHQRAYSDTEALARAAGKL